MNEESIFAAALEKHSAAERQAYLDQACSGNPALREQVEGLLAASDDAGSFLGHAAIGTDATLAPTIHSGEASGQWTAALPFLEPLDKPDRLGKLGHYEVIEVVGHGGMGAVLRAFDTKLSRVVAVKVMAPELAANPMAVKRFQREATAAASVHHDHVVTIHAVEETHRPPYLVMQFIEGQTLQEKIDREGALPLMQILRIGSQMALGLAAAHKLGLIHRDVKPANVLLENGVERVKLTDFGLARAADDLEMTQTGMIAGTPQYMSPEQAKGDPIDTRSDLFSLGSVLYTMCSGRPAFRAETTMGVLHRVCADAPRPMAELNPEIPEWLETIVARLLAKNPADRFQSAAEVAELLGQHLAHLQNPQQVARPRTVVLPPETKPAKAAAETIRLEANLFWATGIMSLVAFGLAFLAMLGSGRLAAWPEPLAIWFITGGALSLPVGLFILRGAQQVQSRNSRGWAVAAAILSLLPINPFLIFCWPITIWSLLTIQRAGVARGIAAEQMPQKIGARPAWKLPALLMVVAAIVLSLPLVLAGFILAGWVYHRLASRPANSSGTVVVPLSDQAWSQTFAEVAANSKTVNGWTQLFNGTDLHGWYPIPPQNWWVKDGVIHGRGPDGFLFTTVGDLEDFHLRVEYRINETGDSGIQFRAPAPRHSQGRWGYAVVGLEAEIGVRKAPGYRSGALTVKDPDPIVLSKAPQPPHAAGEWAMLEIIAQQARIQILLNGQRDTDYTDAERKYRRGHIALASWEGPNNTTAVEFRKVEIKNLIGTGGKDSVEIQSLRDLQAKPPAAEVGGRQP